MIKHFRYVEGDSRIAEYSFCRDLSDYPKERAPMKSAMLVKMVSLPCDKADVFASDQPQS